jgi:hypothetical protein
LEGEREGGREGGRGKKGEEGREGGREGEREEGRKGGREGGRKIKGYECVCESGWRRPLSPFGVSRKRADAT